MSTQQLESLLNEFYNSSNSDPKRIEELDRLLTTFKQQHGAWKLCENLVLTHKSSDVVWFCLSVYEEAIRKHWHLFSQQEVFHVKQLMLNLLREKHSTSSKRVMQKIVEVIIDIAKRTWPDNFPDLLPIIQEYIFDRSVRHIGLTLLHEMVESFAQPRSDISASRVAKLKRQLNQHVPAMLQLLRQVLDTAYDVPGSHNRSQSLMNSPVQSDIFNQMVSNMPFPSPISADTGALGSSPPLSPVFKSISAPRGIIDAESRQTCEIALKIYLSLFSWISLSDNIDVQLLDTMLKFSQMNDSANIQLGILGLTCMTELMSRKYSPPQFVEYVLLTFKHIMETLRFLVSSGGDTIDDLDEEYRSKLTDFMTVFAENHWQKIETYPNVPISLCFDLLFKYTTSQPNIYAYKECLLTWNTLLEATNRNLAVTKYRSGLLSFGKNFLLKLQYTTNPSELGDIEDSLQNSLGQTDFDIFLDECMETIMKLLDLFPNEVATHIFDSFNQRADQLFVILSNRRNDERPISQTAQIHYILKDVGINLRIIGRFSEFFCQNFDSSKDPAMAILHRILALNKACFSAFEQYSDFGDFPKIFVESYAVFYPFMGWLEILKSRDVDNFHHLCAAITSSCIMVTRADAPEKISKMASKILLSTCSVVKSSKFLEYPGMAEFMSNIHEITGVVPVDTKKNLYHMTSLACLTCFQPVSGGVPAEYEAFVGGLTQPYVLLSQTAEGSTLSHPEVRHKIRHVLTSLSAIMESVQDEKSQAKLTLFESMKDTLPFTMKLFELFKADFGMMNDIMDYMLYLFKSVRKQLGPESTGFILSKFIEVYGAQEIGHILDRNDKKGAEILGKFEQILTILVEDNSKMFLSFLPNIIHYILEVLAPITFNIDTEAAEIVIESYFGLLQGLYIQNWKYFFPVNTNSLIARASGDNQSAADPEKLKQFSGLFETIFKIIRRNNPEQFRRILSILDEMGAKCKLFHSEFVRQHILSSLLANLMDVIVDQTHEASKEEIFNLMWTIASIGRENFYAHFLALYIGSKNMSPEAKQSIQELGSVIQDFQPSFTQQLTQISDDIRYYHTFHN